MNTFRAPKSQAGQIAVLLVISLLTMVLTVSLIFNTGQQIHWKTNVQNAVDSAAVSHGANVARSLNVMSVNNVAITQTFTLNILMASLIPELSAATYETFDGMATYGQGIANYCPNIFTVVLCAANVAALARTIQIFFALKDIWDQIGSLFQATKVRDAMHMTLALESMNKQLFANFPNASATMSKNLAHMNGLDEEPVYIGGGAFYANKGGNPNYHGTLLPVEKTATLDSGSIPVISNSISEGVQDMGLCVTGYMATPMRFPKLFWNFQEHGYDYGRGPFPVGRDEFNRAIEKQVDRLENLPEEIPGFSMRDVEDSTDFEDIVNVAYPIACSTQTLSDMIAHIVPIPGPKITLYRASEPVIFSTRKSNPDWSILAIARKEQATGFLGRDLFKNPIKAHYAYSQIEVFNPAWYDLYTQDWTAKLQPADRINSLTKPFVDKIAEHYPEIEPAIRADRPKFNTH